MNSILIDLAAYGILALAFVIAFLLSVAAVHAWRKTQIWENAKRDANRRKAYFAGLRHNARTAASDFGTKTLR